jgi:ABC-2 type transport system permease protein
VFLVEIAKAFRRPRTYVLGSLLAGVAMLPSIVLATTSGGSGGPPFFDQLRTNGLFGGLAGVGLIVPFFLPLGAGLLSGESIAAEAAGGTLRYLLVRPVGRVRLVLTKYWSVMALLGLSVFWVMAVGLAASSRPRSRLLPGPERVGTPMRRAGIATDSSCVSPGFGRRWCCT